LALDILSSNVPTKLSNKPCWMNRCSPSLTWDWQERNPLPKNMSIAFQFTTSFQS
jgi:hypothetical protein